MIYGVRSMTGIAFSRRCSQGIAAAETGRRSEAERGTGGMGGNGVWDGVTQAAPAPGGESFAGGSGGGGGGGGGGRGEEAGVVGLQDQFTGVVLGIVEENSTRRGGGISTPPSRHTHDVSHSERRLQLAASSSSTTTTTSTTTTSSSLPRPAHSSTLPSLG